MTWWQDEGWNRQTSTPTDWESGNPDKAANNKNQPQEWTRDKSPIKWLKRWGELINPGSKKRYWDEKHKTPPIEGPDHIHNSKGEHSHEEDPNGMHYHDINLPRKMYRIQPGDRVLVGWVGDDACVIDIVMAAKDMM